MVAAFRATLEEVLDADLVIHVRDISHPETEGQARDVRSILESLGIGEDAQEKMVEVLNKVDCLGEEQASAIEQITLREPLKVATSALTGQGLDTLCDIIEKSLEKPLTTEVLDLGFSEGRTRSWLFENEVVDTESQDENGFHLSVSWTKKQRDQFEQFRLKH